MNLKNIDLFKYVNCPKCGNNRIGAGEGGVIRFNRTLRLFMG